jgi:hypothetical protein
VTATPIADLRQHPDNPRNGDIELIAESLARNGQYRPIVTATDGTILAGNHVYAAALSLGWTHLDTVTVPHPPESVEARRIMLVDNRASDVAAYDRPLLMQHLAALPDLVGSGWTDRDVEWLVEQATRDTDLPLDTDPLPRDRKPVTCPSCGHEWTPA